MAETTGNIIRNRLTIRVSKHTLSFSVVDKERQQQLVYEPYTVKSGVSMAANLREAFKDSDLLQIGFNRVQLLVDSDVLLIPVEEFVADTCEALFRYTYPGHESDLVMWQVIPQQNVVAAFALNKDLRLVLDDHFSDVRLLPVSQPVWSYLHQRSFTGVHRKLYGYFHDKKLDIFCFDKNRFKFINIFDGSHVKDAVYFLLYVWQHLRFDVQRDELYLVGQVTDKEQLLADLRRYVRKVFFISPAAEFNRAPITKIEGLPFDLMTFYVKK